jgi:hypothetical protein
VISGSGPGGIEDVELDSPVFRQALLRVVRFQRARVTDSDGFQAISLDPAADHVSEHGEGSFSGKPQQPGFVSPAAGMSLDSDTLDSASPDGVDYGP